MICISVTPESRKLAKVDLLNASRQCDLIELCLDRLIKAPDVKDLLSAVDKPVLISCRRPEEGGHWSGNEDQRLTLLRVAIVAEPAYVELDLDTAKKIPRYGKTKRVVSYTSLQKPLANVEGILQRAKQAHADVVKFTWPTPTLDAAWPLLAAVAKKRDIPVVGLGLGAAGLTFSLLGRKYGSPWIYAALEKGMEAFEGQPTVGELDDVHRWRDTDATTRFIGIMGYSPAEMMTCRVFNTMFKERNINARMLPFQCASLDKLKQMLDILKVNAILAGRAHGDKLLNFAEHREEAARLGRNADLLLKQPDGWHAYNSIWRSAIRALERTLGAADKDDRPLDRRNVLVIGNGPLAQSMVYGISRRKGLVSVCSPRDKSAQEVAQSYGVRYVPFANIYNTLADVVVFADPTLEVGPGKTEFNPFYLRPPMTVVDVCTMPEDSVFVREGRERECRVVEPREIYLHQLMTQFKSVTGQDVTREELLTVLEAS
ncbi:MAG TPA: type I 3-dehydroquinate dehydratase [Planctomycetaceae bacterium]|nr:type I 3-dehydroquinate dehydratase [Planctomycetaceae bacterium]